MNVTYSDGCGVKLSEAGKTIVLIALPHKFRGGWTNLANIASQPVTARSTPESKPKFLVLTNTKNKVRDVSSEESLFKKKKTNALWPETDRMHGRFQGRR